MKAFIDVSHNNVRRIQSNKHKEEIIFVEIKRFLQEVTHIIFLIETKL